MAAEINFSNLISRTSLREAGCKTSARAVIQKKKKEKKAVASAH